MLTNKTNRMTLLMAAAVTLGAVACDKSSVDNGSSNTSPNRDTPTAGASEAPTDMATITGANVPSDPLANVENKANVKEYPDETKIRPPKEAQLITGFAVQVRESPRGDVIASTETSELVREVARDPRGDYYLVVFPDPRNHGEELAGWVYKDALENDSWADDANFGTGGSANAKTENAKSTVKLTCARGQSHVRTSIDFCAKVCKDDRECDKKTSEICDGLGFAVHERTGKLANANYCVSSTAPGANSAHSRAHGSSAPLNQLNRNYNPYDPGAPTSDSEKK
jgi:hypothetical protein